MAKTKKISNPTIQPRDAKGRFLPRTPLGKQPRDAKGRFLPRTPLGEFNDSLNIGKEVGNFPNPNKETQDRVDQISNLTNSDSITSLLRIQNRTLADILQSEKLNEEQEKEIANKENTKQNEVIKSQYSIVNLATENNDMLELINNGIIELLPHIKEIEKLTQINSTFLNKLLDSYKMDLIKSKAGLNYNQKLLGYEPSSKNNLESGGGIGGIGGGLLEALGLGAGGVALIKALRKSRLPAVSGPAMEEELKPPTEEPKLSVPEEKMPELNLPEALEKPEVKESESIFEKFKNLLKLGAKKGATTEAGELAGSTLAGGPLGLLIDSLLLALNPTKTASAKEESNTPGFANRFDAPPKMLNQNDINNLGKDIPTMHINPESNEKNIPKVDSMPFGARLVPKEGESKTSVFYKPEENKHRGIFHDWGYSSPLLSPNSLHADVNLEGDETTTQLREQTPISPFKPSQSFNEKSPQIIERLKKDFDLNDVQAASIVGNLGHESGGFKQLQELNPLGGGQGGYGWAQWTGPRRKQFMDYAQANGLDPTSDEANYGFLKHELSNEYKGSITALKNTNDLQSGTSSFEQTFEKAGVVNMRSRNNYAQAALQTLNTPPSPTKSNSAEALNTAIQEKQKMENKISTQTPPIIVSSPTAISGNNQSPSEKAPVPSVRNDDPVLISALKQDLMIS